MGIESRGRYSPTHLLMKINKDLSKEEIEERLTERAINFDRSARMKSTEDRNAGWAASAEIDDADFSNRDKWDFNNISIIYFREDRKIVDSAAKKRLIASRIKAWLEENHRERCPAVVKHEIKMGVDNEMSTNAPIKARIVEVAINWHEKWAVISSQTDSIADIVITLLNSTFGDAASFSRKKIEDMIGDEVGDRLGCAVQILKNVWNHLDELGSLDLEGASISLGSTAVLSSSAGKTTIKGEVNREEVEAAATATGLKSFEALGIKATREELDFEFTILAQGFMIKDLVRPPFSGDSREADLLLGSDLYSQAHNLVCAIACWGHGSTEE